MSTKKNGSYQAEDILCFPEGIELIPYEDKTLVLSVNTGNWIVLFNDEQVKYFKSFLKGKTVGEVYDLSAEEEKLPDLMKVLSSIYARDLALVGHVPHPNFLIASKYLNIYLTNACNLHCVHCFMNAGVKLDRELTSEKWKEVLVDFYAEGGEYVTFTGGEPTMYPQFEEVVMFAHRQYYLMACCGQRKRSSG